MGCVRQMQEQARQYFLTDLRKGNAERKTLRDRRLIMGLFDLFAIQKDEDKPKYEEITIPEKLKYWAPSLTNLRGMLLPGQDMCNRFSFELAKGACKKPPIAPFTLGGSMRNPGPPRSRHTHAPPKRGRFSKNPTRDIRIATLHFKRGSPTRYDLSYLAT